MYKQDCIQPQGSELQSRLFRFESFTPSLLHSDASMTSAAMLENSVETTLILYSKKVSIYTYIVISWGRCVEQAREWTSRSARKRAKCVRNTLLNSSGAPAAALLSSSSPTSYSSSLEHVLGRFAKRSGTSQETRPSGWKRKKDRLSNDNSRNLMTLRTRRLK